MDLKRKTYFLTSLILTISVLLLLVTGSPLLTIALDCKDEIPLGTPITWIGMIALPLTVYWGIQELRNPTTLLNRILSAFLKIIILLGILWVPISFLLAGNLSFSFSEKASFQGGQEAMRWFWRLSYGIGIGTLVIITTYWISLLFRKSRNANP
ncbi:hypothetical protein E4S40_12870 [Algoriphagus kandeliae]|uniref:Uncharacterized protein n=1 Tax=Algoriphagus kandeliae TaxID=2562278 RepID=A0A4Y9QKC3_9BACT|nr:hypothetical protein [Algoriphagus kandeliae]TFV93151.1 hypothetical protein E4S40_12870 [Algoriphagus kandeliae]